MGRVASVEKLATWFGKSRKSRIPPLAFFFELYYDIINQLRSVFNWLASFVLKEIYIC